MNIGQLIGNQTVILGLIGNELGITDKQVEFPTTAFAVPAGTGIIDSIIAPFKWAWDAASAFFLLIAVPVTGIHPTIALVLFGPLIMLDLFIVYGMVRGGGT